MKDFRNKVKCVEDTLLSDTSIEALSMALLVCRSDRQSDQV